MNAQPAAIHWLLLAAGLLFLGGCANFDEKPEPRKRPVSGPYTMDKDAPPSPDEIPADILNTPDAVPKYEPPSRSGNSPSYSVMGNTYEVQKSARDYKARGMASWYGKKFHGHKTASGEPYNMFGMSAAHRTLPLPTYLRVRRVDTGKTVIVKVNDRGPFHSSRILDLSYAAAAKLGMIGHGQTMVELEAIVLDAEGIKPPPPPAAPLSPATPAAEMRPVTAASQRGWLQVAVYDDPINAIALREDLNNAGVAPVEIWSGGSTTLHRVLVGPFPSAAAAQAMKDKVVGRGLEADWVNE